jgi:hypothetical protein
MDAARIRSTIDLLNRYIDSAGRPGGTPARGEPAPFPASPPRTVAPEEPERNGAPAGIRHGAEIVASAGPFRADGPRRVSPRTGIRRYLAYEPLPRSTVARGRNVNLQG